MLIIVDKNNLVSWKMLHFSVGVLLLLLHWFGGLVTGELSHNFSQCSNFFYKKTPPTGITGNTYQPICQRYMNKYRYATLYNRQYRVPVYSAYKVSSKKGSRPDGDWKFEPQLANEESKGEMKIFERPVDQSVIDSQAVLKDYKDSIYTMGHLTPSSHQETQDDREATFTLTNVVPQREGSNSGPWKDLEEAVLQSFKKYCTGAMYVITGALPFDPVRGISTDNNRVSAPEYMWSAYCCPSFKTQLPDPVRPFFPTYAAVGRNNPNSPDDIVPKGPNHGGYDVRKMSLRDLETILQNRLKITKISLFDGQCM